MAAKSGLCLQYSFTVTQYLCLTRYSAGSTHFCCAAPPACRSQNIVWRCGMVRQKGDGLKCLRCATLALFYLFLDRPVRLQFTRSSYITMRHQLHVRTRYSYVPPIPVSFRTVRANLGRRSLVKQSKCLAF